MTEVFTNEDKKLALKELQRAQQARKDAISDYKLAIDTCAEMGMTNVEMGHALGVSEAAIRMMRKRMSVSDW